MTTPTGQITASDINAELGRASTASLDLNDSAVRALAGVASGTISYADLRGKSSTYSIGFQITQVGGFGQYSEMYLDVYISATGPNFSGNARIYWDSFNPYKTGPTGQTVGPVPGGSSISSIDYVGVIRGEYDAGTTFRIRAYNTSTNATIDQRDYSVSHSAGNGGGQIDPF